MDGATVVLAFADDFARGRWQDRQRAELEGDLSAVLEREVRVRCVRRPALPAEAPSDDPMLRAAMDAFRRPERVVEVD